jgi:predicted nuclease with TOPRIM domain
MQITKATYKRLVNLGSYENRSLELTIDINENDDVNQLVSNLVAEVELRVRDVDIEAEVNKRRQRLEELKTEVNLLEARASKLKQLFDSQVDIYQILQLEPPADDPTVIVDLEKYNAEQLAKNQIEFDTLLDPAIKSDLYIQTAGCGDDDCESDDDEYYI